MKKKRIALAAFLFVTFAVHAAELSQQSLQGSWVIVSMNGERDDDNDRWEFAGNKFYQVLYGQRVPADEYKIEGRTIDLGYGKIEVRKFDGRSMTARMGGVEYVLRKH